MASYTNVVLQGCFSGASLLRTAVRFYGRFMKEIVAIVAKAFRQGFYWLTAHADAEDLVSKCDGCQKFSKRAHVPAQELRMILITWPFAA